jgi:hypothetical protein
VSPSHYPDSIALHTDIDSRSATALGDSLLFAFDQAEGRVVAIGTDGDHRWRFGRTGDGPGEIARPFSQAIVGVLGAEWLTTDGSRVVLFDGRSVFYLSEQGALLERRNLREMLPGGRSTSRRIRAHHGAVLLDVRNDIVPRDSLAGSPAARTMRLYRLGPSGATSVATLLLPSLPRSPSGGVIDGVAEAKAAWDLSGDCVVMSDGHSDRFVFGDPARGHWDTVVVDLPELFADADVAADAMRGLLPPGAEVPAPAALARIAAMTLSADGVLWLRPSARSARSDAGELVWRYEIRTGALAQLQFNVFPRFVTPAGGVYGLRTGDDGVVSLVHAVARD